MAVAVKLGIKGNQFIMPEATATGLEQPLKKTKTLFDFMPLYNARSYRHRFGITTEEDQDTVQFYSREYSRY